jgi:hypothetical protein
MAFTPTTFVDLPSTATPITAAELNKVGLGLKAALWIKSARDYGAVLDDSTNDATALQAAITACSAAGGGVVLVDGRMFIGTTIITVPSKVHIWGIGWEASWIRCSAGASNVMLDYSGASSAAHSDHQGLASISLRGSTTATGTMLRTYYTSRLRVTDVFFFDSRGKCNDMVEAWDCRFTRCHWNTVGGIATDTPNSNSGTPVTHIRNSSAVSGFGNSTDNSNMIWFTDCHWENYASGAVWIERGHAANASNPNGIFFTHCKFETHRVRNIPIVVGDQASLVHFRDCDVVLGTFDTGIVTAVDAMLIGGVSNIIIDGIRFVGADGVSSIANGINWFGQTGGAYMLGTISHEGNNPTNALVNFGGLSGKWDLGTVTTSASATLFGSSTSPTSAPIAFSATITPAVTARYGAKRISLTGNLTMNAPTGSVAVGDVLVFELTNDATPRTVTWNATFKTTVTAALTASKTTVVEFRWNGTNWVQVGTPIAV